MAFEFTHRNLGRIKSGRKYEIRYPYDETVSTVSDISLSCGCTGASHYPISREVVLSYVPQSVPLHMKGQGYYTSRNHATVNMTLNDGSTFPLTLTFEAIVY